MKATVESLLQCLPPYEDRWITVHPKQQVRHIINEILEAHKEFAPYYDDIALYFLEDSTEDICKKLYSFLKKNIHYKEEKEEEQTTALPTGILTRRQGDCKHYSSFAGGVLDAINRITGRNIDWNYRFASYDALNSTPHHVFTVVKDEDRNGEEIWIDPTPGASDMVPVWITDKKIKISPMALRRNIAGIGIAQETVYVEEGQLPVQVYEEPSPTYTQQLEEHQADTEVTAELQSAIEILMHYGVMNETGAVNDSVLKVLSTQLTQEEFNNVANARLTLQAYIADALRQAQNAGHDVNVLLNDPLAIGSLFSDIWRGVKKVSAAPMRNAYLSLVALNAFGMATKLANAIYNADGTYYQPGQQKLYNLWNKWGGDWHNLHIAIDSGKKKHALLGSVERPVSVGDVNSCQGCQTIGVAAAALPAWVAIAGALIAAITPLVKEILNSRQQANMMLPGVDPTTGLPYNMNSPSLSPSTNFLDILKNNAIPIAAVGVGAYFLLGSDKKKVNAVRKAMSKKTTGLLILGGTAAYLLYKHSQGSTDTTTTDTPAVDTTGGDTTTGDSTTTNTPGDATNVGPKTTGFLFTRDLMPYYDKTFNPQAYLARYPDIRQDKYYSQNPLEHYQKYGQYEGRFPSADPPNIRYDSAFDPVYYGDRYPDIPQHFGTDYTKYYQHWQQYGRNEGRKPGGAYLVY